MYKGGAGGRCFLPIAVCSRRPLPLPSSPASRQNVSPLRRRRRSSLLASPRQRRRTSSPPCLLASSPSLTLSSPCRRCQAPSAPLSPSSSPPPRPSSLGYSAAPLLSESEDEYPIFLPIFSSLRPRRRRKAHARRTSRLASGRRDGMLLARAGLCLRFFPRLRVLTSSLTSVFFGFRSTSSDFDFERGLRESGLSFILSFMALTYVFNTRCIPSHAMLRPGSSPAYGQYPSPFTKMFANPSLLSGSSLPPIPKLSSPPITAVRVSIVPLQPNSRRHSLTPPLQTPREMRKAARIERDAVSVVPTVSSPAFTRLCSRS